ADPRPAGWAAALSCPVLLHPPRELGVGLAHVRFPVEDPERLLVHDGAAGAGGAGVHGGAVLQRQARLGTTRLVPGGTDGAWNLATVRVEDVRVLAFAAVVVVQYRELSAVNRHQIVDRDPGDDRHDRVDLHQGLPAVLIDPQGRGHRPLRADVAERRAVWAVESAGPGVCSKRWVKRVAPEIGVGDSEGVEAERAQVRDPGKPVVARNHW